MLADVTELSEWAGVTGEVGCSVFVFLISGKVLILGGMGMGRGVGGAAEFFSLVVNVVVSTKTLSLLLLS